MDIHNYKHGHTCDFKQFFPIISIIVQICKITNVYFLCFDFCQCYPQICFMQLSPQYKVLTMLTSNSALYVTNHGRVTHTYLCRNLLQFLKLLEAYRILAHSTMLNVPFNLKLQLPSKDTSLFEIKFGGNLQ